MRHQKTTALKIGGLTLFLMGVFLALEAARLPGNFSWEPAGAGLFILLGALEMLCGFVVVDSRKRRFESFIHIGGALLLTLRAAAGEMILGWAVDFILTGGTAAFLVRRRKRNTFLLFGAAFSLGLLAADLFPAYSSQGAWVLAILLTGLEILQARSLGKGRCFFLLLPVVQLLLWAGEPVQFDQLWHRYQALRHTAVSTLPASLLPETQEPVSVFQITRSRRFLTAAPWEKLPHVGEVQTAVADEKPPLGYQLRKIKKKFDIVSLEILPRWHERSLQVLLSDLAQRIKSGGILLVPRNVLKLLPPGMPAVSVPGSEGERFAAGKNKIPPVEELDHILQSKLMENDAKEFMLPGVFAALFQENKTVFFKGNAPRMKTVGRHSLFFWIFLTVFWLFLRLVLGLKGNRSAFLAQVDNYASGVLILLAGFCLLAGNRFYSLLPESLTLWCLVLCLPGIGKKGSGEKSLLLASLILPWMFAAMKGTGYFSPVVLGILLTTALSIGVTSAKLFQETDAVESRLKGASLCGTALGGLLFYWLFSWENLLPVLLAAFFLRSSCLLRK